MALFSSTPDFGPAMRHPQTRLAIAAVLAWAAAVACAPAGAESSPSPVDAVDDLSLPTTGGDTVELFDDPSLSYQVLCFLGTECPLAGVYGPQLDEMARRYRDSGVRFVGINSNVQDSMDELRAYVREHEIGFPVAKDYDRSVAGDIGASRTPEVFVVDPAGRVRYSGRIDDRYEPGIARAEAKSHDLQRALDQLLAGQRVTVPRTEAVGCLIALPRERTEVPQETRVTFCDQVSRVLQDHCVECHREGEIGPFALTEYDEVVGWADMMLEVIRQGRMPPWHASDQHATFANARHMPEADKELLRRWVDQGMPYGDARKLPPQREYVQGWRLPKPPDAVLAMSESPYEIPPRGTIEYQYFVVDPGFEEDKWVRAVDVVPGNRSVVHHCIAFIRPPDGADLRDLGFLAAYVPGQQSTTLPEGYARRVAAGSKIVFQMHYTPTGKPESDITRVGLVFTDPAEVTHEVSVRGGIEHDFEIPPHAPDHEVTGEIAGFSNDALLLSMMPHMHLRGKAFEVTAESDGAVETLLEVPFYDFNWQHKYTLATPRPLAEIERLGFTATFDNSADNPTNPDPSQHVTWGDQTWQEMAVAFIEIAEPREPSPDRSGSGDSGPADSAASASAPTDGAKRFAENYIARFDHDGDDRLSRDELPESVRLFAFDRFDHNGDRQVDRSEIAAEAMQRGVGAASR